MPGNKIAKDDKLGSGFDPGLNISISRSATNQSSMRAGKM